ncbi:MAG: hypothetical protein KIH69_015345 [Anaerolineae bacterium]|nr:hypothetical protein [Anaerolineae bacterium]
MVTHKANLLDTLARWWLIALVFVAALGMIVLFRLRAETLQAWSGLRDPILDAQFGYTPAFAYERIRAIGAGGRQLYALTQLTLDIAFPFAYSLLASLLVVRLYRFAEHLSWVRALRYVPWLNGAVDVVENLSIAALLLLFPTEWPALAHFASAAGVVKWSLGGIVLLVLALGLLWRGLRFVFHKL